MELVFYPIAVFPSHLSRRIICLIATADVQRRQQHVSLIFTKRDRPVAIPGSGWWHTATLLAIQLLVAGCSFMPLEAEDLKRSHAKSRDSYEAILAGSVTNPDPHTGVHSNVRFFLERVDGTERFYVSNAHSRVFGGRETDIGFESVAGKLFAVPVRAGEYQLTGVYIFQQMTRTARFSPRVRFRVEPGEVLYIGSFEVANCYSVYMTPSGERRRETVVGGLVSVRDNAERDLPALREAFPDIRESRVVMRVVRSDLAISRASEELSRSCAYGLGLPKERLTSASAVRLDSSSPL